MLTYHKNKNKVKRKKRKRNENMQSFERRWKDQSSKKLDTGLGQTANVMPSC